MALFCDRNNKAPDDNARLTVAPSFDITGTIYLALGEFNFRATTPRR